jgi:hypothetical protein
MMRVRATNRRVGSLSAILVLSTLLPVHAHRATAAGFDLPEPTGRFPVGTVSYVWEDETREEVATPSRGRRQLVVQLWYPGHQETGSSTTPYVEGLLAEVVGQMFGPEVTEMRTHAVREARVAEEHEIYPVVLLSPGFGISRSIYTILCEDLASHGYIVASMDHPYLNLVELPEGQLLDPTNGYWETFPAKGSAASIEEAREKLDFALDYFAADHLFVLAKLAELNRSDPQSLLTGWLDLDHVASLGHSAGALAPQGLMLRESPVDAAILYDVEVDRLRGGPEIVVAVSGTVTVPVLAVRLEYAPPPEKGFEKQLQSWLYDVHFEGASHLSISDVPFLESTAKGDDVQRDVAIELLHDLSAYTRSFLDTYLKGDARPSARWSYEEIEGVAIEVFGGPGRL